jgi:hypothetical protein
MSNFIGSDLLDIVDAVETNLRTLTGSIVGMDTDDKVKKYQL